MPAKLSQKELIKRFINIHGDTYNYDLVVYKNRDTHISIKCKKHGVFHQLPLVHASGFGCSKCSGKFMDTEIFIEKAESVHSGKYNYDKVEYINSTKKVIINCKNHGDFFQAPSHHLQGQGCKKCGNISNAKTLSFNAFLKRANKIHNHKYAYDESTYINMTTKIPIGCPDHDIYYQMPHVHLSSNGCSKCSNRFLDQYYFIERANKIHEEIYDYTNVEFINGKTKVEIICSKHGPFYQKPNDHLQGRGCIKCANLYLDLDLFIEKANKTHNNKYCYNKVIYKRSNQKVKILCPKHGYFMKSVNNHLRGQGCPRCGKIKSRGELKVEKILNALGVTYEYQKSFSKCKDKRPLPFDFYLPDHNICIEYDGIQHFEPVDAFGGNKSFEITKAHDAIKTKWCIQNEIHLLRIKYTDKHIKSIITNFLQT